MKSPVHRLLQVAVGLLEDVRQAYPDYGGVDRDIERLTRNSQTRGLGFFTLDLPHLDSILLDGLETGLLKPSGPLCKRVSRTVLVPRFLVGLWSKVFDSQLCLREDADVNAILFLRQISLIGKKIESDCSSQRLSAAVSEYHDIEDKLPEPTLDWAGDGSLCADSISSTVHFCDSVANAPLLFAELSTDSRTAHILERIQRYADFLSAQFRTFSVDEFISSNVEAGTGIGFRHGPGAVAESGRYSRKYEFPNWPAKLQTLFKYEECGTTAGFIDERPCSSEFYSRLIAVPKTAKSPRLIASEPTSHQWCQQAMLRFFSEEFDRLFGNHFISLRNQERSGEMARKGSLDRSLCTIDLSSASDRLTCYVVERIFRSNPSILNHLHACRTRIVRSDLPGFTGYIRQKKFASQGTAVTFPVQSFVFLVIALAVSGPEYPSWRAMNRLRHKVRVFGDDIIIPSDGYADMVNALHYLSLRVNANKSFVNGYFRESCGYDYYKGYDITPVKPAHIISDGPMSTQAIVDTSNNLFLKGFWRAATALDLTMGSDLRSLPITGVGTGITGRTSYVGSYLRHLKRRWNSSLQRFEVRTLKFISKVRRKPNSERFALLQFFTESDSSRGIRPYESGYADRPSLRKEVGWVDETLLSHLG